MRTKFITCGIQTTFLCAMLKTIQLIFKLWKLRKPSRMMLGTNSMASNFKVIFQFIFKFLCIHFYFKDSLLTPSMKMSLHTGSNVMLRFAILIMKIRHVQQVVTKMKQQQQLQRLRHQQLQQQLPNTIHIGFVKCVVGLMRGRPNVC